MKTYFPLFLFCFLSQTASSQIDSLFHEGRYRTWLLHLPEGYNPDETYSLVIAMHGGFGSGNQFEEQSGLSGKADAAGFIVVYPEGVPSFLLGIRTWNAGTCCGFASANNIDDVGFIAALVDTLVANYSIDPNRIYATGMSNGGFMCYRLACELSDRIAAIAPVASSSTAPFCSPERAVPIIHFHSYLDTNVPFQGGVGSGFSNHHNPPLDSLLNAWSVYNNCQLTNDTLRDADDFDIFRWGNCSCDAEIRLYITHDGGHSWPGGIASPVGDPPSQFVNADDLMWDFFQQFSLDCSVTAVAERETKKTKILLYPNPAFDLVHVDFQGFNGMDDPRIRLLNLGGQTVKTFRFEKQNSSSFELRVGNLKNGVYFLEISTEEKQTLQKVVIGND